MRQTTIFNSFDIKKKWYLIDAKNLILGRLATNVALILKGKKKSIYTPHIDCGDYVIIINADKINLTGNKMKNKIYFHHSQFPGGLKKEYFCDIIKRKPVFPLRNAIKGMIPKNKLGKKILKKLFIYSNNEHPHEAQKPIKLII